MNTPNPGSDEAVKQGCRCAILDNAHGWGYMIKGQFWVTQDCPLHGTKLSSPELQERTE